MEFLRGKGFKPKIFFLTAGMFVFSLYFASSLASVCLEEHDERIIVRDDCVERARAIIPDNRMQETELLRAVALCLAPLAELGAETSLHNIAVIYVSLSKSGNSADRENAKYWTSKAAKQGQTIFYRDAFNLYLEDREFGKAIELAQEGSKIGNSDSLAIMGIAHWDGIEFPRDGRAGFEMMRSAAYQGVQAAQLFLYCIQSSPGREYLDYKEAYVWLELFMKQPIVGGWLSPDFILEEVSGAEGCEPSYRRLNPHLSWEEIAGAMIEAVNRARHFDHSDYWKKLLPDTCDSPMVANKDQ